MHAVTALLVGVVGAGNGTAELYMRGTSQRAPYWTDFEASQQVAAGTDVQLDTNGGAAIYVGQLVDVVVKSADGNEVRSFVAGAEAPAVEVRSQSFIGTDYVTGAQAAGNPTTLQAVLDLVKASFGSTNFRVLVGAVPTLLSSALAPLLGVVFNVKDPTYGAQGNGTSDDTSAVQAAITACVSAGGGTVVIPEGTFRITAALHMTTAVNLLGVGAAASILKLDHATRSMMNWSAAAASQRSRISGLGFEFAQTGSGAFVDTDNGSATNNVQVLLEDCYLDGQSVSGTGILVGGQTIGQTGKSLELQRCTVLVGGGTGVAAGSGVLSLLRCTLVSQSGAFSGDIVQQLGADGLVVALSRFDGSASSSGSQHFVNHTPSTSAGALAAIIGNSFLAPTGSGTGTVACGGATEAANTASSGVLFTGGSDDAVTYSDSVQASRERTYRRVASTIGTYTMPDGGGTTVFSQNFAGNFVVTVPTFAPGRRGRHYVHNLDGSNRDLIYTASASVFAVTGAGITMTTATYTQVDWEMIYMNGHAVFRYWVTDANRTPP